MPKKWGVNDKKVAGQEKKIKEKEDKQIKLVEEKEKQEWEETDKHTLKKLERKQIEQEKKEAAIKKKQEKKELYEKEMQELTKGEKGPKITHYQADKIKQEVVKEALVKADPSAKKPIRKDLDSDEEDKENPIQENINHIKREEDKKALEQGVTVVSASGLADAVKVLTVEDPDRHPEKRMKKAYEEFQDKMLPKLKVNYPGLKRSQYLNMLQKEWKSSPENPTNKTTIPYNAKP